MRRAWWLGVILALALTGVTFAQVPVDLDGYEAALIRALQHTRVAMAATGTARRLALDRAVATLQHVEAVRLPNGETVPVDNTRFVEQLTAEDPDLEAVVRQLESLLAELREVSTGPVAGDPLAKLERVLGRPPFDRQPARNVELPAPLRRLRTARLRPAQSELISNLIAVSGVALLVGVMLYFVRGMLLTFATQAQAENRGDGHGEGALSAADAWRRAQSLATGGDYRSAVRYLYLSTLLLLDERDLLRYDRSLTNREVLREVAGNRPLVERLRPIVETFDRVWYGSIPCTPVEYDDYRRQIERVRRLL